MLQEPGRALDLPAATLFGQQLFFANMQFKRFKTRRLQPPPWHTRRKPKITAISWRQEPLFDIAPDPDLIKQRLLTDRDLLHHCQHIVDEHAIKYGWSKRQRNDVVRSLRLLHHLQDTPGAKIKASEVLHLPRYDGNISSTLDVLAAAGLLIDDRPSHLERYFAGKTDQLPPRMKTELQTWLEIMLNGSNTAPRQRLRDPMTVRIHILGITPILTAWVADGRTSLAEITAADVRAALPPNGSQRNWAEFGLRSLFGVLKARKMIFANPTRGMKVTPVASTIPMPLNTAAVREALNSPDPAIALAVALVAFHAITSGQLASLLLSDIVDGRLRLGGRTIPLAAPVRVRLSAWLDHRASTWPNSINPHLFVSRRSAPRLNPVGRQFPWTGTNLRPQALREDRILNEIHATGGDIRALCDLFGLGVAAASRYRRAIEHPDLTRVDAHVPRT